jgi:biofilm PGA synthesis N-glycosyltransferase PgaC
MEFIPRVICEPDLVNKRQRLREIGRIILGIPKKYPTDGLEDWLKHTPITVLVPAYNEAETIRSTLSSIKNQDIGPLMILVVDDHSLDGTGEIAKSCGEGVVVVRTEKNTGTKAQAQNYGLKFILRGVVVTIDADTVLPRDAIRKIIPPLMDHNVASTCGFVIPQRIHTIWERARFIEYLWGISIIKESQNLFNSPLVSSGCFSAYRIEMLKNFDCFKDRTMAEDMDLTWSHLIGGYDVVLIPEAVCYPLDPYDIKTYINQIERWYRGFLQVVKIHNTDVFKRPALAFFVIWSLIESFSYPFFIATMLFLLPRSGYLLYGLAIAALGFFIPGLFAVWEARKTKRMMLAIMSIPAFIIANPVNFYVFLKSAWFEIVLRKPLTKWHKGH